MQSALQLAEEFGYPVFPCRPTAEVINGEERKPKTPRTPHGFKDASSNREQIVEWWERWPDSLVGVPTGKVTDLYVIDVDPAGLPWLEQHREQFLTCARVHETKRHGRHLFYSMPADDRAGINSQSKLAPGVDTRGEGGYVVWWPAHGYRVWLNGQEESPPPVEVPADPPRKNAGGNGQTSGKYGEGERHGALLRQASHLRHAGVRDPQAFEVALLEWNKEHCDPPQDDKDVRRIAHDYLEKPEDKDLELAHADAKRVSVRMIKAFADMTISVKTPLVRDLLFPGAYVLVGRPKIGKSWLLLQLALAVAEGETFLGFNCQRADVLAVFGEDDDTRLQKRLMALGVANYPDGIYYMNRDELRALATQFAEQLTFTQWLEDWLSEHPKVRLVLLDTETTVKQVWTGEVQKTHYRVTESDYQATRTFDELALRREVVLLLVNHASKGKGKQQQWIDIHEIINRSATAVAGASGSIAIADPPDADPFDPDPKGTKVLGVRGRDLEHELLLAVHQDKDRPAFVSDGLYVEVRRTQAQVRVLEALTELQQKNPEGWHTARAIGVLCDRTANSVTRVLTRVEDKRYKNRRLVSKQGKGYRFDDTE